MSTFSELRATLADRGCTLLRAVPRAEDHLLLQVRDERGTEVAGQWFDDPGRAALVAAATAEAAPHAGVRRLGRVVLQPRGADRRLPALTALVHAPGARLVAHRPERRAVVAHQIAGEPCFTKVVRRGRATALADELVKVAGVLAVPVPDVVAVDPDRGAVTTRALPGRTLHARLREVGETEMRGVGRLVAELHGAAAPDGVAAHAAADELAVVHRWLAHARTWAAAPVPAGLLAREVARLETLLGQADGAVGLLHRDLHDKQLLLGPDRPGVLDLDLLAAGDPALDLANLVVHLELRARQGLVGEDRVRGLVEAMVEAYDPSPAVRTTAPAYLLATRLRLVGVYAFRPDSTTAAVTVLTEPLFASLPD